MFPSIEACSLIHLFPKKTGTIWFQRILVGLRWINRSSVFRIDICSPMRFAHTASLRRYRALPNTRRLISQMLELPHRNVFRVLRCDLRSDTPFPFFCVQPCPFRSADADGTIDSLFFARLPARHVPERYSLLCILIMKLLPFWVLPVIFVLFVLFVKYALFIHCYKNLRNQGGFLLT